MLSKTICYGRAYYIYISNIYIKPKLVIPNSEIGSGYTDNIFDSLNMKNLVEKHLRTCGKGNFTIFPFLQLHSNDTDLRRKYEDYFIKKYKTKLNSV